MENDSIWREGGELTEIYRRNVDMVYRICYVYLRNAADAEDAVQTVFLKLLKTSICFSDCEHERAWLITAAKNYCRDVLKSWWRRKRVDLEWGTQVLSDEAQNGNRQEGALQLTAKLLSLPEKYRVVLYLHYFEGYSVEEMSQLLNRNEITIRSQLQRGRQKLKLEL